MAFAKFVLSASDTNRNASRKLLLPDPFGPTKQVKSPKVTSQAAMLLKFFMTTRVRNRIGILP